MVIEVMTNVNVPFGTVNWKCRGQEEKRGEERNHLLCITSRRIFTLRGGRRSGNPPFMDPEWIYMCKNNMKYRFVYAPGACFIPHLPITFWTGPFSNLAALSSTGWISPRGKHARRWGLWACVRKKRICVCNEEPR